MTPTTLALFGLLALGALASFVFLRKGADPTDLEPFLSDGATLLDVRSPSEFASGSIRNAVNIPVGELMSRLGEVPDGPVVVFCASGVRSRTARAILEGADRRVLDMSRVARFPSEMRT